MAEETIIEGELVADDDELLLVDLLPTVGGLRLAPRTRRATLRLLSDEGEIRIRTDTETVLLPQREVRGRWQELRHVEPLTRALEEQPDEGAELSLRGACIGAERVAILGRYYAPPSEMAPGLVPIRTFGARAIAAGEAPLENLRRYRESLDAPVPTELEASGGWGLLSWLRRGGALPFGLLGLAAIAALASLRPQPWLDAVSPGRPWSTSALILLASAVFVWSRRALPLHPHEVLVKARSLRGWRAVAARLRARWVFAPWGPGPLGYLAFAATVAFVLGPLAESVAGFRVDSRVAAAIVGALALGLLVRAWPVFRRLQFMATTPMTDLRDGSFGAIDATIAHSDLRPPIERAGSRREGGPGWPWRWVQTPSTITSIDVDLPDGRWARIRTRAMLWTSEAEAAVRMGSSASLGARRTLGGLRPGDRVRIVGWVHRRATKLEFHALAPGSLLLYGVGPSGSPRLGVRRARYAGLIAAGVVALISAAILVIGGA